VSAILDHIDGILVFPLGGRARDDLRPGMRTSTFKKRTLVAYEVDESSGELVVNILGVFHGGRDWEAALGGDQGDPKAGR
jgi:toxin ParE1/3/4